MNKKLRLIVSRNEFDYKKLNKNSLYVVCKDPYPMHSSFSLKEVNNFLDVYIRINKKYKENENLNKILEDIYSKLQYDNTKEIIIEIPESILHNYYIDIMLDFIVMLYKKYNTNFTILTRAECVINRLGRHIIEENLESKDIIIEFHYNNEIYYSYFADYNKKNEKYKYDAGEIINYPFGFFGGYPDLIIKGE